MIFLSGHLRLIENADDSLERHFTRAAPNIEKILTLSKSLVKNVVRVIVYIKIRERL